jgi:hypothetical protein
MAGHTLSSYVERRGNLTATPIRIFCGGPLGSPRGRLARGQGHRAVFKPFDKSSGARAAVSYIRRRPEGRRASIPASPQCSTGGSVQPDTLITKNPR